MATINHMLRELTDSPAARAVFVMLLGVTCVVGMEFLRQPAPGNDAIALQFIEKSVLVLTAVTAACLLLQSRGVHRAQIDLLQSLLRTHARSAIWRARVIDVMAALGGAVDRQFARWGLSPPEREVALLLLKGYDCADIALLRDCSERAVRRHARLIYGKASLDDRVAFASYFLDDLRLTNAASRR